MGWRLIGMLAESLRLDRDDRPECPRSSSGRSPHFSSVHLKCKSSQFGQRLAFSSTWGS